MKSKALPIKDKELFLRYAIPCGKILVGRGEIETKLLEKLRNSVLTEKEIVTPIENVFKIASRMCTITAKRMGKKEIDKEVIRKYFLEEHDKAVLWRSSIKPDLKIHECLVYPGRVLNVEKEKTLVSMPLGERWLKNDFAKGLKPGDWVSTHYDYVIEKIGKSRALRMFKRFRGLE